jgi:hypothetical protein
MSTPIAAAKEHLDETTATNTVKRFRPPRIDFAEVQAAAFSLAARRQGRDDDAQ